MSERIFREVSYRNDALLLHQKIEDINNIDIMESPKLIFFGCINKKEPPNLDISSYIGVSFLPKDLQEQVWDFVKNKGQK